MANDITITRFLYENSVSHRGHLIIPFISKIAANYIYSYTLLSQLGHKGQYHQVENPANLYSNSIFDIIEIAKEHLEKYSKDANADYFKYRYTYHYNLIITHQEGGKCFYDHYPPDKINNIAAPKLFKSEIDCINWVKKGLDRNYVGLD